MANNSVVTQEVLQNTLERYHEDFVYPYQNGATHTGFTPVGTVISYFGETAPEYFLICDGTEYAKSDYPQLADLLLNLTDPTPFEGSDANHFKVPDLRGEFLRGTGTNGHTNQGNGSNVGTHQDATESILLNEWGTFLLTEMKGSYSASGTNNFTKNTDTIVADGNVCSYLESAAGSFRVQSDSANRARYTSRPTNTSVLYCIAYKNIYIDLALDSFPLSISNPTDGQALVWNATEGRWKNAGILHEYSTGEKVVGKWIDGKPLYEKTIVTTIPPYVSGGSRKNVPLNVPIDIGFVCSDGSYWASSNNAAIYMFPYLYSDQAGGSLAVAVFSNTNTGNPNTLCIDNHREYLTSELPCVVTIRYTKTTDTV